MVAMMAQPWWWILSPWLSPAAAWFIFFNTLVAAIAVMSWSSCAQHQEQQDGDVPSSLHRRLCHSASSAVLDQLRSFCLLSVHPTAAGGVTVPPLDDLDLAGDVSKSDYNYHSSHDAEVAPAAQVNQVSKVATKTTPRQMAPEPVPVPAPESKHEDVDAEEEQPDRSISLEEAYAMVQQSHRLPRQSPPASQEIMGTPARAKGPQRRRRGREAEELPEAGKAELNSRADLFIRQFREDLKLQRLNSLLRHAHAFEPCDGALATAVR